MHVKTTKNNNSNSKFKYFFDVFGSAEGKEVRVASAVQRRSEGRASRGAGGAKARFRKTSKRAGAQFRKTGIGPGDRTQFRDLDLET
jgi:hypothetical protein